MKRIVIVGLIIFMSVALLASGACAPKPAERPTLKIGMMMPLTGPTALWGDLMTKATQVYVDLLNTDGGVLIGDTQYAIELFVEDDKYTPEGASAAAHRLFYVHEVDALVGHWLAPTLAIGGDMAVETNKVHVSAYVHIPGLEVLGPERPNTFGAHANMGFKVPMEPVILRDALRDAGVADIKVIAGLFLDDPIGRAMSPWFKELAPMYEKEYGIKLVYNELYPFETLDYVPWLLEINALPEKVDLIMAAAATGGHFPLILKQGYEINPEWLYFANPYIPQVEEIIDMAGPEAADRGYYAVANPWESKTISPEMLDMVNRMLAEYEARFGEKLTYGGAILHSANCLAIYLDAAKKAGSIETEKVIRVLETEEIEHFYGRSTASGEETFGLKRHFLIDTQIAKIQPYERDLKVVADLADLNQPPFP